MVHIGRGVTKGIPTKARSCFRHIESRFADCAASDPVARLGAGQILCGLHAVDGALGSGLNGQRAKHLALGEANDNAPTFPKSIAHHSGFWMA